MNASADPSPGRSGSGAWHGLWFMRGRWRCTLTRICSVGNTQSSIEAFARRQSSIHATETLGTLHDTFTLMFVEVMHVSALARGKDIPHTNNQDRAGDGERPVDPECRLDDRRSVPLQRGDGEQSSKEGGGEEYHGHDCDCLHG